MKERYLRSVQALLDCPEAERERLLRRQESAMTAYLADEPEATEADLLAAFGTPEDCAARLLAECDPAALAAERGRKRRRSRALAAVLAVLLVLALALAGYLWSNGGLVIIETTHYETIPEDFPTGGMGSVTYEYED